MFARLRRWWRLWCNWDRLVRARAELRDTCPECVCRDYPERRRSS